MDAGGRHSIVTSAILGWENDGKRFVWILFGSSCCCTRSWDGQYNWRTSETVISVSDLCLFDSQTHTKHFLTPLRQRESRKMLVRFQDVDDSDDFLQHLHQQRSARPWHINCESWRSDGSKQDQGKSSSARQQEKEWKRGIWTKEGLGNHTDLTKWQKSLCKEIKCQKKDDGNGGVRRHPLMLWDCNGAARCSLLHDYHCAWSVCRRCLQSLIVSFF